MSANPQWDNYQLNMLKFQTSFNMSNDWNRCKQLKATIHNSTMWKTHTLSCLWLALLEKYNTVQLRIQTAYFITNQIPKKNMISHVNTWNSQSSDVNKSESAFDS